MAACITPDWIDYLLRVLFDVLDSLSDQTPWNNMTLHKSNSMGINTLRRRRRAENKFVLVQKMPWRRTARHYLNQWWPSLRTPIYVTWPRWVNHRFLWYIGMVEISYILRSFPSAQYRSHGTIQSGIDIALSDITILHKALKWKFEHRLDFETLHTLCSLASYSEFILFGDSRSCYSMTMTTVY